MEPNKFQIPKKCYPKFDVQKMSGTKNVAQKNFHEKKILIRKFLVQKIFGLKKWVKNILVQKVFE